MRELFRRLEYLFHRRQREEDLAAEMEYHRELAGRANFGNTLLLREESRDAWGWTIIDRTLQDLRYAARVLRRSPGFTLAAILMLAIGIGVNVATFGFFNLLALKPLPIDHPENLLRFKRRGIENYAYSLPYPEAAFFAKNARTLSGVLTLNSTKVSLEMAQKQVFAHFVSSNFFDSLGAHALLGRAFHPSDGNSPVAVLSHSFWQTQYAADPSLIGKTIRINGQQATVLGILASDFSGLSFDRPAFWIPIEQHPIFVAGSDLLTDFSFTGAGVRMWGRLQPGIPAKAAEDELSALAAELRQQHPKEIWDQERLLSIPGGYAKSLLIGNRRGTGTEDADKVLPMIGLIGALGLLILAVACSNLGSLMLARGVAREREMSIRAAVGAGKSRLIRQLFTESLLLAFLGSIAGLFLGYGTLRSVLLLSESPAWLDPMPNWPVYLFSIGIGVLASIVFGLAPAFQVIRQKHRSTWMRQTLVTAQVAASCILLIVASLLVRALNHALTSDPGFNYEQVIAIDSSLAAHGFTPAQAQAYLDKLRGRLASLSGVASIGMTVSLPLGGSGSVVSADIDGRHLDMHLSQVDATFHDTMKIPILRGRGLDPNDPYGIVISDALARKMTATEDPIGREFLPGDGPKRIIRGIAGNAHLTALKDPDAVEVYFLAGASEQPALKIVVRTLGPADTMAQSVGTIARSIDSGIIPDIQLLKASFYRKLESTENSALVVTIFGSAAHFLACFGLAGVIAYVVSQRTRELGLRMALGARPNEILSAVLVQFWVPVLAGLILGLAGAVGVSNLLRRELYGISNLDPQAYLGAIAIFAITVSLAALIPARRALKIDPMTALKSD
ncbi:ABC transporter permease [Bryobacter aggregatus]|uniref:ABC transporter permease n=1 Tax=Bryobacter aggregatus TaxID=360054 RepID=UPI0004E11610|nr:ABC transporter permease [Bryobacter aggregatus]